MIVFTAHVDLKQGTNLKIIPNRRFSPNLQFMLPGLENAVIGLAKMETNVIMSSGGNGNVRIKIYGVSEFEPLAVRLEPGTHFILRQGPIQLGSGVVLAVEERTIDEATE